MICAQAAGAAKAYVEAARLEVVVMYNRAAKEVTRRELALDRVLDEFDKHKTEDLVDGAENRQRRRFFVDRAVLVRSDVGLADDDAARALAVLGATS